MNRVIDIGTGDADGLRTAVDATVTALSRGGLVVLPTDTVYGLAADAGNAEATAALFDRKGRDATVPVAVLCIDADQAFSLAAEPSPAARRLAAAHWPGPLTLVEQRRPDLGWFLGEPSHTIGLRCPDHEFLRAVIARVGPLATTSANRHGVPTPSDAGAAAASLQGDVDVVVDGGRLDGVASTVVDVTGRQPVVLRQGQVVLGEEPVDGDADPG